jgi:hypothetical protein
LPHAASAGRNALRAPESQKDGQEGGLSAANTGCPASRRLFGGKTRRFGGNEL